MSTSHAESFQISTGSKALDELIGGGIKSSTINEAFGETGAGITQLSHTLCVTCQINNPSQNYCGGKAFFIDTENSFRRSRIRQIAKRFGMNENDVLENILIARAYNTEHLMELLTLADKQFKESKGKFRLIVFDSIMALFRVDYSGRGDLTDRQKKLTEFLKQIREVCEQNNIAVFLTNQMTANPAAKEDLPQMVPVGGKAFSRHSDVRLFIKIGEENTRFAEIWNCSEKTEVTFQCSEGGITDI